MKKLSNLVIENNTLMTYKYTASINIEGTVNAHSEGDAGELIDKEIDVIGENTTITNYTINNIEETEKVFQENIVNENNDDDMTNLKLIQNEIIELYYEKTNDLTPYYKAMLTNNLADFFGSK